MESAWYLSKLKVSASSRFPSVSADVIGFVSPCDRQIKAKSNDPDDPERAPVRWWSQDE